MHRRSLQLSLALALLLLLWSGALLAGEEMQALPPKATYAVPASCPRFEELARRTAPEITRERLPFSVDVREVPGGYELTLGGFEQKWRNASCRFLIDIAAFSIGMALTGLDSAPAQGDPQLAFAVSRDPDHHVDGRRNYRETARSRTEIDSVGAEPGATYESRSLSSLRFGLAAVGQVLDDRIASPRRGFGLALSTQWRSVRVSALGVWTPPSKQTLDIGQFDDLDVSLEGRALELDSCWLSAHLLSRNGPYLGGCGLVAVRWSELQLPTVARSASTTRRWPELGLGAIVGVELGAHLYAELQPGVLLAPWPAKIDAGVFGSRQSALELRGQLQLGWRSDGTSR
jgi:hypothetical protein